MAIAKELKDEWRGRIKQAEHGNRRKVVEEIASTTINPRTGKPFSPATIYRAIDITNGQKKSTREPEISPEYIDLIAREKAEAGKMGMKKRFLATEDAIENLEQAGLIPEGLLNSTTVDRRLREAGWNKERVYDRHEDKFVNEVHHFDMSRAEYFDGGIKDGQELIRIDGRRGSWDYKNKEKAERKRLWVAGYIDSFSRVYLVRYFMTTGENLQTGTEALEFFWQRRDEMHPMVYPPKVLKFDQGSIGKYLFNHKTFQRDTGIRIELAASKNDRYADNQSQGKIERSFRTLWQKFELKLAMRLKRKGVEYITLEQLNMLAHAYAIELLEKKHPVRSQTRGEVYRAGLRMHEPTILETSIWDLLYNETTRKVSHNKELSFEGELYKAPAEFARQRIYVYKSIDGRILGADLDRRLEFSLELVDPDSATGTRHHAPTHQEESANNGLSYDGTNLRLVGKPKLDQIPHTLPHDEVELAPKTPFTTKKKKQEYFTDWDAAKMYICKVFECRWSDLNEASQHILESVFNAGELTKDFIDELETKTA